MAFIIVTKSSNGYVATVSDKHPNDKPNKVVINNYLTKINNLKSKQNAA